jgi:hypothetical protein
MLCPLSLMMCCDSNGKEADPDAHVVNLV